MSRYDDIALKIVPKRSDRTRGRMRQDIAEAIAKAVTDALDEQRVKQFPEIGALVESLKRREAALTEAEKRMQETNAMLQQACQKREAAVKVQENNLVEFHKAFDAYAEWLDGYAPLDENGKRFGDLRTACMKLKETKR